MKRIDTLEELHGNLRSLALRNKYFERPCDIKKEIKIRNVTRKKIDEDRQIKNRIKKERRMKNNGRSEKW